VGAWLEALIDGIVGLVQSWGYTGIFVMMLVESSFVPFPSEVALIPAGYLASQGKMDPVLAVLAGVCGSLGGALINYGLALWLGRGFLAWLARFGRWFALGQHHLDASERYFQSHGEITTFVGRLIPGIRQLISIPAGLSRMNLFKFLLYTSLGAGLWSAVLVVVGFLAGESEEIWRPLLQQATVWLVAGMVLLVAAYLALHRWSGRLR
jgi:membrane protein DedA with SNARE-associated domain